MKAEEDWGGGGMVVVKTQANQTSKIPFFNIFNMARKFKYLQRLSNF